MKRLPTIGLLCIPLLGAAGTVHAQKFGYVNSIEILAEMPAVKQADANLEALQRQLQAEGKRMVADFQKQAERMQKAVERGELSPKQQEEETKKLQAQQDAITKFEQSVLEKMQQKRNDVLKPIYDRINTAIEAVAKENGLTFIFEKGVLLYADESQDVSNLVKARLAR